MREVTPRTGLGIGCTQLSDNGVVFSEKLVVTQCVKKLPVHLVSKGSLPCPINI